MQCIIRYMQAMSLLCIVLALHTSLLCDDDFVFCEPWLGTFGRFSVGTALFFSCFMLEFSPEITNINVILIKGSFSCKRGFSLLNFARGLKKNYGLPNLETSCSYYSLLETATVLIL